MDGPRGPDGGTPYENFLGGPWNAQLVVFGEQVRYTCSAHEGQTGETDARWSFGTWIGVDLQSGQHMIHDDNFKGVCYCRTILLVLEKQKWKAKAVAHVSTTP